MPLPYRFLAQWFSGVSRNRKMDRRRHRRRLLMESLETRSLLAADLASIAGTAFIDQTDDGLTPGDAPLAGVAIDLYLDGGDGIVSSDDMPVGSTTTDSQGNYRFDGLTEGLYFVKQGPVASVLQRPDVQIQAVVITAQDAQGTPGLIIDSFDSTTQSVVVTGAGPDSRSSSMLAPEAIGGQRDLRVELDSGIGDVRIRVNHLNNGLLRYDLDRDLVARGLVTWDGQDNDADQLDANGLGSVDITEAGINLGIRVLSGINLPGGSMTLRVYSDATNFSSYTLGIPVVQDGDPLAASTILFADPSWASTGTGVDLTNVGAIQLEIDAGVSWADCDFKDLGTVRPTVKTVNFANLNPMSLGDTVWFDQNNNGFLDAGEQGIAGVELTLYEDTDEDGVFHSRCRPAVGDDYHRQQRDLRFRRVVSRFVPGADRPDELRARWASARVGCEHRAAAGSRSEQQRRQRQQRVRTGGFRRRFTSPDAGSGQRAGQRYRPRSQRQLDFGLRIHRTCRPSGHQVG
jgi:hypothetical protein